MFATTPTTNTVALKAPNNNKPEGKRGDCTGWIIAGAVVGTGVAACAILIWLRSRTSSDTGGGLADLPFLVPQNEDGVENTETTVRVIEGVASMGQIVSASCPPLLFSEVEYALRRWSCLFETCFPHLRLQFLNKGIENGEVSVDTAPAFNYDRSAVGCGTLRFVMAALPESNTLAVTWAPWYSDALESLGPGSVSGTCVINSSMQWRADSEPATTGATSLGYVLTHELGHAFGIGHSIDAGTCLMQTSVSQFRNLRNTYPQYPASSPPECILTADEVLTETIKCIYGLDPCPSRVISMCSPPCTWDDLRRVCCKSSTPDTFIITYSFIPHDVLLNLD